MKDKWFAIVFVLLCPLLVLPSTAAVSGPRSVIDIPNGCVFTAKASKALSYPQRCADAISKVDLSKFKDQCNLWDSSNDRTLTLNDLLQEDGPLALSATVRKPKFHNFGRGLFLIKLPCSEGAYNQTSLFFRYDETHLPAVANIVLFPHPNGKPAAEIWSRAVSPSHHMIIEYMKERGLGDSGYYARYFIHPGTLEVTLAEAIEKKDQWDGEDPFQWTGKLTDKPKGKGWKRIYPVTP